MLKTLLNLLVVKLFVNAGIIADGAKLERIADEYSFTEGPAVDWSGNVYFTDQPKNHILKWSAASGDITLFTNNSGRANGLYVSNDGNLLSCSDMDNQLWSIDVQTGTQTVMVSDYEGKLLNGPNDVWQDPYGGIYFTDPLYPRDYWTRDPKTQQSCEGVYYIAPNQKEVVRVVSDLVKPNGIVGTSDGVFLYIADIGDNKTYKYEIQRDGSLAYKKLFVSMGSDGMTIDNQGNVYLVGDGVTVFNPSGEKIEYIPIEADWTANICFGGEDFKTLFITASQYVYTLRMNVRGTRWK